MNDLNANPKRARFVSVTISCLGLFCAADVSAFAGPTGAGGTALETSGASDETGFSWGPREVEHVWNRAGFGIRPGEIDRWVEAGPEALVDYLLAPRPLAEQTIAGPFVYRGPRIDPVEFEQRTIDERRAYRAEIRRVYAAEFARLRAGWVRRMVRGEDPLRDRLTLFWHGVFTSSYETVREPGMIGRQHNVLRRGALGSYEGLLRAMLRDPAMLVYLSNDKNKKGKPNENLAREVMELFSLGEGSGYTELDVQEAARALTGAGVARDRDDVDYRFERKDHDSRMKTILGVEGQHGPDDLATILLAQPACARFIAGSLIEYMEGLPPEPERLERYAGRLRGTGYDIAYFMRTLLLDPAFYRPEVVGARVSSPIDYVVGSAVRFGGGVPPGFLVEAASSLGQNLFRPPNVKGWEEGIAWISTASFMLRGNVAGALLGRIDRRAVREETERMLEDLGHEGMMDEMSAEEMATMSSEQSKRDEMSRLTRLLKDAKYKPSAAIFRWLRAQKPASNAEIVALLSDRLLAIEPPAETLIMLEGRLDSLRKAAGHGGSRFFTSAKVSEPLLRELCHLILSLPEAQLH
ncbi:hypothetical protein Poly30_51370 [Planctomycetes bacterium Poly30]|uniref:DUF1800 domain-containing protein n=1 Tax=Saltatorellus ferox TaxID=2528018 RepID=A0A518EZS8_9BACT|nr:hypothetical protein Poly30_51370 [Planctomycetes bacterium Poly30]